MKTFEETLKSVLVESKGFDKIDMKYLEKFVSDVIKTKVKFKKFSKQSNFLVSSSDDLSSKMVPVIFDKLVVTLSADTRYTTDADTIFVKIEYSWTHFKGGTNGTNIAVAEIDSDGKVESFRIDLE